MNIGSITQYYQPLQIANTESSHERPDIWDEVFRNVEY
jgi:hypothetical protein